MKWPAFLSPLILQKLIWVPTHSILNLCGRVEVRGFDKLQKIHTNVIFAANHSSESDVFLIPGVLPFFSRFSPIFYTSRERDFYKNAGWRKNLYGGFLFKMWGAYPVSVGLRDYEKSLKYHIDIVRSGGNLLVFPEGGITKDGNLRPAKGGVAYLSYVTGRPVVPVYLGGTFRIPFFGFFLGRRKLHVSFGEPMYVRSGVGDAVPTVDDFKKCANHVMEVIGSMQRKALKQPYVVPVRVKVPA